MLSLLVPSSCPVCGEPGAAPCAACWRRLEPAPAGPPPAGVERCRSLLRYDDGGRELLARFKYHNARAVLPWLADGMAALAAGFTDEVDVVTWAPTTAERRRHRGFDQAELLARAVGRRLHLPVKGLLVRHAGPPQTGRNAAQRHVGPEFEARRCPPVLLLVDDVLTSGGTLAAAAAALRGSGAQRVIAITAARTPLKIPQESADA